MSSFLTFCRKYQEQLTAQYDDVGMRCEPDAFDTLFDHVPDKLAVVKRVRIERERVLNFSYKEGKLRSYFFLLGKFFFF